MCSVISKQHEQRYFGNITACRSARPRVTPVNFRISLTICNGTAQPCWLVRHDGSPDDLSAQTFPLPPAGTL